MKNVQQSAESKDGHLTVGKEALHPEDTMEEAGQNGHEPNYCQKYEFDAIWIDLKFALTTFASDSRATSNFVKT